MFLIETAKRLLKAVTDHNVGGTVGFLVDHLNSGLHFTLSIVRFLILLLLLIIILQVILKLLLIEMIGLHQIRLFRLLIGRRRWLFRRRGTATHHLLLEKLLLKS